MTWTTISAALMLAAAGASSPPAARDVVPDCSVTHHQCYPACIELKPDGSDCQKIKQVCRDVCGERPVYPSVSNTEMPPAVSKPSLPPEPLPANEYILRTEETAPPAGQ